MTGLPESTYCSDPLATHFVSGTSESSAGIQGYYRSEFDAHRVARHLRATGFEHVSVSPMPSETVPGIHPLVMAYLTR